MAPHQRQQRLLILVVATLICLAAGGSGMATTTSSNWNRIAPGVPSSLALKLAALTDATTTSTSPMDTMATLSPLACPNTTCLLENGDCLPTSYTDVRICPDNQYENKTETPSCNCRSQSDFLPLGSACNILLENTDVTTSECGPLGVCAKQPGEADADAKCYGDKLIGDACSWAAPTNGSECTPPRRCSATTSKCEPSLAAGAVCYNSNDTGTWLGICPLHQYCPDHALGADPLADRVCTDYLAIGASCDFGGGQCPPGYAWCDFFAQEPICDYLPIGELATGELSLGGLSCVSGLANSSTGLCVDYDTELAKWEAAFPNPQGIVCGSNADCNLPGVQLAECACPAEASAGAPYCRLSLSPTFFNRIANITFGRGSIAELGYLAGCERPSPLDGNHLFDASYCAYNWTAWLADAICPSYWDSKNDTFVCPGSIAGDLFCALPSNSSSSSSSSGGGGGGGDTGSTSDDISTSDTSTSSASGGGDGQRVEGATAVDGGPVEVISGAGVSFSSVSASAAIVTVLAALLVAS